MTIEEATDFFSAFYFGAHHIPGYKPRQFGSGWYVNHDRGGMATYDFNQLTRLVVLAHDRCIRAEISALTPSMIRIAIWKRKREGDMAERHPELEDHIKAIRNM